MTDTNEKENYRLSLANEKTANSFNSNGRTIILSLT